MPSAGLGTTLGALFIGTIAASILYGFNCLQTFIYHQQYSRDRLLMRLLVFFLWILDTLQLVLVVKTLYLYCVDNFSNREALANSTWQIIASTIVTIVSNTIVRCFFALRVYILGGKKWFLPSVITIFCFTGFGAAIAFAAKGFRTSAYSQFHTFADTFYVVYGSAVAADICIASALCWYLRQHRTGIFRTDTLLTTLTLYCVNTGLITCISHIATLIAFAIQPNNFIYAGIYICSSKWYYGAFLATLNARKSLRHKSTVVSGTTVALRDVSSALREPNKEPNPIDFPGSQQRVIIGEAV